MIAGRPFRPAWWLPGPHLQTLWPVLFRRRPRLDITRERLELPDGDFLDLSWSGPAGRPLVLLLHGLEGGIDSHYMGNIMLALNRRGWQAVLLHFRNCGDEPNRLARSYHSGETGDLSYVLDLLWQRRGIPLLGIIGYSLGGNVLLKWLGEQGSQQRVQRAVAVSVPFQLAACAGRLDSGISRLYQLHLLTSMRASYTRKRHLLPPSLRLDVERLESIYAFDDRITAPLHGFADADDYYHRCSSRGFLLRIRTPTLILHARDDPFMYPSTAPTEKELAPEVILELSEAGGHLGFVSGTSPWRASYWLEERICDFLDPAPRPRMAVRLGQGRYDRKGELPTPDALLTPPPRDPSRLVLSSVKPSIKRHSRLLGFASPFPAYKVLPSHRPVFDSQLGDPPEVAFVAGD